MRTSIRTVVVGTAGVVVVGGLVLAGSMSAGAAGSAAGNHEKRGDCGANAFYDAEVERDDGGLEGSFEIDGIERGEKWRIQVSHNGDRFLNEVRSADYEREIDVEWFRDDTSGRDAFKIAASKVGGGGECSVTIRR